MSTTPTTAATPTTPAPVTLKVDGMSCQHCVAAVTKALQAVPGVERATVELEPGRARVTGSAAAPQLVDAVRAAGYGAEVEG